MARSINLNLSPVWIVLGSAAVLGAFLYFSKGNTLIGGTHTDDPGMASLEYTAAAREFASAKGLHTAALLRKTDHPEDAAAINAYNAAAQRLYVATSRFNSALDAMRRLGFLV